MKPARFQQSVQPTAVSNNHGLRDYDVGITEELTNNALWSNQWRSSMFRVVVRERGVHETHSLSITADAKPNQHVAVSDLPYSSGSGVETQPDARHIGVECVALPFTHRVSRGRRLQNQLEQATNATDTSFYFEVSQNCGCWRPLRNGAREPRSRFSRSLT
jgi:hypothetical protein